jgi:hypothetical protein
MSQKNVKKHLGKLSLRDVAEKCKKNSVADSDPGSGAFLTPGSGFRDE